MRQKRPTAEDIAASLTAIKLLVGGLKDAMPSLAVEIRRDIRERLDDAIDDLGRMKR